MENLDKHIESIIFSSEQPIQIKEIKDCLEQSMETKIKKALIEESLNTLLEKYKSDQFSFEIIEISNGYQFLTKGAYHHTIGTLLKQKARKRLSKAALETLAIIAYKQPVTKSGAEAIRGVSCDYSIQKLLEKELITILGRSDSPGRPLLYGTSEKFMDYFGLKSIAELPKLKEFKTEENSIGEGAPVEETILMDQNKSDNFVMDSEENNTQLTEVIAPENQEDSPVGEEIEQNEPTENVEPIQEETLADEIIDEMINLESTEEESDKEE